MRICPNCNNASEEAINFCPKCGSAMVEQAPTPPPAQPQYQTPPTQPQYQYQQPQPVYNAAVPSKGKIITGMALSIAGIAMAGLGFLYTLMFLGMEIYEASFIFGFVFTIFSLPLSIVGLILSSSCINAGSTNTMCRVGKILGLVGVIVSGVILLLAFASAGSI